MQLAKRLGALARSIALVTAMGGLAPALAQTPSGIPSLPGGITMNDLPADIQQQLRGASGNAAPALAPEEREPRAVGSTADAPTQPSLLEEQYSRRAGRPMEQIGYGIFRRSAGVTFREVGAIPDSYVLGVGDQIVVHMRGRENNTDTVAVNREGAVVLPSFPPIPAADITFGEFRDRLRREAAERMLGTDVFVSLGEVREIGVTMTGEVVTPGVITLSSQASLVDAIRLSGGIKKTGSLRGVKIYRDGATIPIDLYDFVLGRADVRTMSLTNGDRIFVPVIGNTVGVSGQAKRPGIYELPEGSETISSSNLLELGGGTWVRGSYRFAALRVLPSGTEQLVSLGKPSNEVIRSGEILFVEPATDVTVGSVVLSGHVRLPGPYPYSGAGSVRSLLRGYEGLQPNPYLPFAVVETADPRTRASRFEKFDLGAALSGRRDVRLSSGDQVFVFGLEHVRFLASTDVAAALQGQASRSGFKCAGLDSLARWVLSNPESDLASGQFGVALRGIVGPERRAIAATERGLGGENDTCPQIFDQNPGLLTFALQNAIVVRGNVLNPGVYPVAGPDGIDQVMDLARALSGGRQGSLQAVGATAELNRIAADRAQGLRSSAPRSVTPQRRVSVADVVDVEEDRVRLIGHVRFPGTRSLASAPSVRALIGDQSQLKDDPYLLYGLIMRRNPETLMREIFAFSPADALSGGDPIPLASHDVVKIFGFREIQSVMQSNAAQVPSDGQAPGQTPDVYGQPIPPGGQPDASGAAGLGSANTAGGQAAAIAALQQSGANPSQMSPTSPAGIAARQAFVNGQQGGQAMPGGIAAGAGATGVSAAPQQGQPGDAATGGAEQGMLAVGVIWRLVSEASVELLGQVVIPGRYPIIGEIALDKILSAAGGVAPRADMGSVEITRFVLDPDRNEMEVERQLHDLRLVPPGSIKVTAGTVVLVNPLVSEQEIGLVEIRGEVKRPGRYGVVRGEKLSSLIQRAGGLQPLAYPTGAVFTRNTVKRSEMQARNRAAAEFHRALIGRMSEPTSASGDQQMTPQQVDLMTDLLQKLQSTDAVGRMVVELNPIVLEQRPEFDVTLEGGDSIVIPRRPLSVFVSGEVFNPGAQQFTTMRSITEYIEAAGGTTDDADLSNAFIVRPNGSAERINFSVWGSAGNEVLPGSWIVVPRDVAPLRLRELATTVTQIFSQLAVSAASIAVISR